MTDNRKTDTETRDRPAEDQLLLRIMSVFPAGHYALNAFFRLADICLSKTVDTAAVECRSVPRLLLNSDFITAHCRSDEHLFMLVMHELHHVLLGHTRLFQRLTELHNIAFDAVINAILCMLFPDPLYTSFFTGLYKPDVLSDALLRPPEGWPHNPIIPKSLPPAIRHLIATLYTPASGTFKEVFDALTSQAELQNLFGGQGADGADGQGQDGDGQDGKGQAGKTVLLGDHSPEGEVGRGESAANHPAMFGAVRKIVETWPMPPDPIRGRSIGTELRDIFLERVKPPPAAVTVLKRLVRRMVEAAQTGATVKRTPRYDERNVETPLPSCKDRRAMVLDALGGQPLIYRDTLQERRMVKAKGLTTVYVDVSGSTNGYWKLLAAVVRPFVDKRQVRLFAFSEVIDEITPDKLAKGKFRTTGGTDAKCIWEHAAKNGFHKLLIVTDGYVGEPSQEWQHKLKEQSVKIRVALTPEGFMPDLEGVADEIVELPLIEK